MIIGCLDQFIWIAKQSGNGVANVGKAAEALPTRPGGLGKPLLLSSYPDDNIKPFCHRKRIVVIYELPSELESQSRLA